MRECVLLLRKCIFSETHDSTVNWGKVVKFFPCLLPLHVICMYVVDVACRFNVFTTNQQDLNAKNKKNYIEMKKTLFRSESLQQIVRISKVESNHAKQASKQAGKQTANRNEEEGFFALSFVMYLVLWVLRYLRLQYSCRSLLFAFSPMMMLFLPNDIDTARARDAF